MLLVLIICLLGRYYTAFAALLMPPIIGDHMVIQAEMDVPIWGTAGMNEAVTVEFNGQTKSTTAGGNDGTWEVVLDPMPASVDGKNMNITAEGGDVITLVDVWVGEVWLSSGQSNMNMNLGRGIYDADEAIADMDKHNIRRYKVNKKEWQILSSSNGNQTSAVHYFFAHEIATNLNNIAGGMIETAVRGSGIEQWTHTEGEGFTSAGLLYESRIMTLQPFAIRGALWYQGEDDVDWKSGFYYDRLVGLITEWRDDWAKDPKDSLAFGIVQLPWKQGPRLLWPVVQDSQLRAHLDMPNTGLAVTWDLDPKGEDISLHPYTKKPIGERLALWALAEVYGQTGFEHSGPIRNAAESYIDGNAVYIVFDRVGSGLETLSGRSPFIFKIAGNDGTYHDAKAQIIGDSVVNLTSTFVPNPVSARFVWDYGQGDLYNDNGGAKLPAAVFELTLGGSNNTATLATTSSGEVGDCGGGRRGNGVCANGKCCSQVGWCGDTTAHCSSKPTTSSEDPEPNTTSETTTASTNEKITTATTTVTTAANTASAFVNCTKEGTPEEMYYELYWAELPQSIQDAYEVLGYTDEIWDEGGEVVTGGMGWDQLSQEQRDAALCIGYDGDEWPQTNNTTEAVANNTTTLATDATSNTADQLDTPSGASFNYTWPTDSQTHNPNEQSRPRIHSAGAERDTSSGNMIALPKNFWPCFFFGICHFAIVLVFSA